MTIDDSVFLPLKATNIGLGGKRTFEADGKRRLIEACLRPGTSISGMALKAGVNSNQLHKWLRQHRQSAIGKAADALEATLPAFMPVVTVGGELESATRPATSPLRQARAAPQARLSARLPNGVMLELECLGHEAALVTAFIAAVGAH